MKSSSLTIKELRIIQALCFLNANWSEDEEDSLKGVSYKQIEALAEKFIRLYEEEKKK
jgi:HD-like signal output (HDOD) protein